MKGLDLKRLILTASAALMAAIVSVVFTTAACAEVKSEVVLDSLDNPCGVVVHTPSGDVFVSDSAAGRVVRCKPTAGAEAVPVITGFPQDIYGKGPMFNIGPLGLLFLKNNVLVVGGGELKDGEELVRFYDLPASGKSVNFEQMKYVSGPIAPGEESLMGEGNFYALALVGDTIFITCNGDDTKGWVSKIDLVNGIPGKLVPFIKTKVATSVDAPVGITVSANRQLVIGQMGEVNMPKDSLLTIYDPMTGNLTVKATTDLYDIAGLAYSPKTGKLYAVDFAWMDTTQGGLFRLDLKLAGSGAAVKAEKILALDKPSALAFGADGALFVTVFGSPEEGSDKKSGKLLKITGDL